MKFNLNLTALSDAMGRYFLALQDKAVTRVVPTVTADDSDKLTNFSYSDLETQALETITDHSIVTGDPHNLTPADVGGYSEAEVRAQVATRMPDGILALSTYGTPDYLPVGVANTFEGATTITGPKDAGLFVEDDGTLIVLRNGTNGSNRGVYYAYLRNAMVGDLREPIRTNKKYQPAFFPAGTEAAYVMSCSDEVIFGRLQNSSGTLGDFFVALTNGTYNDAKHTGAIIAASAALNRGYSTISGGYVYLFNPVGHTAGSGSFGFNVWSVAVSTVKAGGTVALTKVTGISTTGFSGVVAADMVHLANAVMSDTESVKPVVLSVGTGWGSRNVFHYEMPFVQLVTDVSTGVIRAKVIGRSYFSNGSGSARGYITFSFTYNPSNKVAQLDLTSFEQAKMTIQSDNTIVPSGTVYANSPENDGISSGGNTYDTRCLSGNGFVFHMFQNQQVDSLQLFRSRVTNFTTKFEALKTPRVANSPYQSRSLYPAFGSAVGGKLAGAWALSNTRMVFFAQGRGRNGQTMNEMVYTDLEGSVDAYTHKSIYNDSYLGYKPSATRDFLVDVGVRDPNYLCAPITEVTSTTISVAGTRYQEGNRLNGPVKINPDFTTSGEGSISQAVLDTLKSRLTTALASDGGTVQDMAVEVVIPQTSGVPPFAAVTVFYTNRVLRYFVARLNIAGGSATGVITSLTVHSLSPRVLLSSAGLGITRHAGYNRYQGATVIYTVGSICLIGHSSPHGYSVVGNGPQPNIRFKYNKSTGEFVFTDNLNFQANNVLHSSYSYYASPSLGFGMINGIVGSTGANDELTKIVFVPITKTSESEFDAWTLGGVAKSNYRVLASQEVAQGWMVYMTEETSVVINGRFYKIPPQNFNLLDITSTPASRTFYVHVQVVNGEAQYLISLTKQTDSSTLLYLGRIVTGTSTITSIDVRKASRLENIQLVAAG